MSQRVARNIAPAVPGWIAAEQPGLLVATFEALEAAGLRYCVLRGCAECATRDRRREVDLLLDARDLASFGRIVSELGFVHLPAWGYGGHSFCVAYEEAAGTWLKLDVVTSLRYGGRSRPLFTPVLAGCLDRRRRANGRCQPDLVDALLGLVLHGVLDKGAIKEEHRRELKRLLALVEADDTVMAVVVERFEAALGRALLWSRASAAIACGDWEWLLERRRPIAWALFRRNPFGCTRRWLGGEILRLVRPVLVAFSRRGFSVALLGPDGSGKTSLARALAGDAQLRAQIVYMGSNLSASTVGLPSTRWIGRRRTARLPGRGSGRAAFLGGISYGNRLLEQGYRSLVALALGLRGRFVVFDRHPYELLIAEPVKGWGPRFRRWLLQRACVRPDLVLMLDAPSEKLRSRKTEHTLEWFQKQRERYRSLPLAGRDFFVLDTSAAEQETFRRATSLIWHRYRQHVAKTA